MRERVRLLVPALVAALALPIAASASHNADAHKKMALLANSPKPGTVNTDLAFWGNTAITGDYRGIRVIDISTPTSPVVRSDFLCNGSQGDVSIWGNLVFRSIDRPQTTAQCAGSTDTPSGQPGFEGIRIIDITNPSAPAFVKGVATDCGSHTHTLLPDLANNRVLLYVSSFPDAFFGPTPYGTNCRRLKPDGSQGHSKISIVAVPLGNPASASVVAQPTFELEDWVSPGLRGCHDIGVFLEIHRAAAACLSEGQLWDISDPLNPVTLHRLHNPEIAHEGDVAIWHSGSFTWDGKIAVFGDEALGSNCEAGDPTDVGAVWFYDVDDPSEPLGHFKIPHTDAALCTAHNYNVIPVRNRYFLVSAWYGGGTSVANFTDPAAPREVAFYDAAGPPADTWSSYWYNGKVYAGDIGRGLDIFRLQVRNAKTNLRLDHLNPQTQEQLLP